MDIGEKLVMIGSLSARSGIIQTDYHDIKTWTLLAGEKVDMSVFSDKTIERIQAIYTQFFEE